MAAIVDEQPAQNGSDDGESGLVLGQWATTVCETMRLECVRQRRDVERIVESSAEAYRGVSSELDDARKAKAQLVSAVQELVRELSAQEEELAIERRAVESERERNRDLSNKIAHLVRPADARDRLWHSPTLEGPSDEVGPSLRWCSVPS